MTDWLTPKEAAAYLKVSPRTICQWARAGEIPAHKLCGNLRSTYRFTREELDAILRRSLEQGATDGTRGPKGQ